MQGKYIITGYYKQDGVKGNVEGNIQVRADGLVTGNITDKLSRSSERSIKGRMTSKKGVISLDLLCEVPDENLLNIRYSLTKPEEAVEGKYTGSWLPVKKLLDFKITGSFEAFNGETWYNGIFPRLEPYKKDLHPQHVELVLERTA